MHAYQLEAMTQEPTTFEIMMEDQEVLESYNPHTLTASSGLRELRGFTIHDNLQAIINNEQEEQKREKAYNKAIRKQRQESERSYQSFAISWGRKSYRR